MAKPNLLLVDNEPKSLRLMEVSLKKSGFSVTTSVNGLDALEKVVTSQPELIISETRMPEMDGFEFCKKIKESPEWSDIPFIFLTNQRSLEDKVQGLELGAADYLTKPIYIREIITRIRIHLQRKQRDMLERRHSRTKFSGHLVDMGVVDILQTIEISRKSGTIKLLDPQSHKAHITFKDGQVIDAELGRLRGADAVYRLLVWSEGNFDLEFCEIHLEDRIQQSVQALLMEGLKRVDEWQHLTEQLPSLDSIFDVDPRELGERLSEIPDELNNVLRLFDSQRSILEVLNESDFGDLETLNIISKLYFEGIIFDISSRPVVQEDNVEAAAPQKLSPSLQRWLAGKPWAQGRFGAEEQVEVTTGLVTAQEAAPRRAPLFQPTPPFYSPALTPPGKPSSRLVRWPSSGTKTQPFPPNMVPSPPVAEAGKGRPSWPDSLPAPQIPLRPSAPSLGNVPIKESPMPLRTPLAPPGDEEEQAFLEGDTIIPGQPGESSENDLGDEMAEEFLGLSSCGDEGVEESPCLEGFLGATGRDTFSIAGEVASREMGEAEEGEPILLTKRKDPREKVMVDQSLLEPSSEESRSPAMDETDRISRPLLEPEGPEDEAVEDTAPQASLPPPPEPAGALEEDVVVGRSYTAVVVGGALVLLVAALLLYMKYYQPETPDQVAMVASSADGGGSDRFQPASQGDGGVNPLDGLGNAVDGGREDRALGQDSMTEPDRAAPGVLVEAAEPAPVVKTKVAKAEPAPAAKVEPTKVEPVQQAKEPPKAEPVAPPQDGAKLAAEAIQRGKKLSRKGKSSHAIKEFEKALSLNPRSDAAHLELGNIYLDKNATAKASGHFKKALTINSRNADAHLYLATIYQTQNNRGAAAKEYRSYLKLAPSGKHAAEVKSILSNLEP